MVFGLCWGLYVKVSLSSASRGPMAKEGIGHMLRSLCPGCGGRLVMGVMQSRFCTGVQAAL